MKKFMDVLVDTAKGMYELSTKVTVFFICIYIFETFYPLGEKVQTLFGNFGMMIGQLIGIWALVGVVRFFRNLGNKYDTK